MWGKYWQWNETHEGCIIFLFLFSFPFLWMLIECIIKLRLPFFLKYLRPPVLSKHECLGTKPSAEDCLRSSGFLSCSHLGICSLMLRHDPAVFSEPEDCPQGSVLSGRPSLVSGMPPASVVMFVPSMFIQGYQSCSYAHVSHQRLQSFLNVWHVLLCLFPSNPFVIFLNWGEIHISKRFQVDSSVSFSTFIVTLVRLPSLTKIITFVQKSCTHSAIAPHSFFFSALGNQ